MSEPSINRKSFSCDAMNVMPPPSVLRNEPLHRRFKAVAQAFRQQALQQMRAEGITEVFPGAAPLLLHLGDEDGLPLSELARRCGLESSTLTPLVDELEARDLVFRARASEDRRIVRVYLTPRGLGLEPRLRALLLRLQEAALSGIPDADIEALHRVLERIAANLDCLSPSGDTS
jgi:DNA-binding MarR family transcriptional regulator